MKIISLFLFSGVAILFPLASAENMSQPLNDIQFICMKTHKASNTCHFNFRVDGADFRFVDVGCKYSRKQDELVKKVEEGTIFLAKDWKIRCPEPKTENK